jgi:hypothetical protein
MADDKHWSALPTFNVQADNLTTIACHAIKHFSDLRGTRFVILFSTVTRLWHLMPVTQHIKLPPSDPRYHATALFTGDYNQLHALALAFPNDLFKQQSKPNGGN